MLNLEVEKSTSNQFQFKKAMYPRLRLAENRKREFLCWDKIPPKYKTLRVTDPRIDFYFTAIKKLLGSSFSLDLRDIWICEKNITVFPILVFFTEPVLFPIMDCCQKCIYIEFQTELSGSVKCSNCNNTAFAFVRLTKDHRQEKSNKQNNFMNESETEVEKKNKKLYKEYKDFDENRKLNVRKLISSNQHREVSIKKILGLTDGFERRSYFGNKEDNLQNRKKNEGTPSIEYRKELNKVSKKVEPDIEFIIELEKTAVDSWSQETDQVAAESVQTRGEANSNIELSATCLQIKEIIDQIFT